MKDSFVTEKFVLDLSGIKVSYVETNPRFKDSFFTKYSFPFEFHLTRDLKIKMGDYTNINAIGLEKKYHGYHIFEGRKRKGILEIIEVEGDLIRAQIDSGFEYFPNFEKKLSEIPFEKIEVNDIYTHAEEVCKKSYPAVNYNFPRVIYTKHLEEKGTWEYFNQFLNDRDENGFINNGENTTEPVNRNIIHPMPYLLYVLKKGFADAGFQIEGDILEDTDFKQRVIYNNKEIFNKNEHEPIEIVLTQNDEIAEYEDIYEKNVILPEKGKWLLQATAVCITTEYGFMAIKIELNDNEIYHRQYDVSGAIPLDIFIEMDNNVTNGTLKISMLSQITPEYPLFSGNVNLKSYLNIDNNTIFYIKNSNIIDISRSMPDMTFGDLVRTVKNWKNYDLEIAGNKVYMNLLKTSQEMIDATDFEVTNPIKKFGHKRSFKLAFPEMDKSKDNFDNIVIDNAGINVNGISDKNNTEIKINGYCLPIESFRGVTTAIPKKDDSSVLGLIYYDGLYKGKNYAQNPNGLMPPHIGNVLKDWFKMRINSSELRWSFIVNKNKFRHINIKDTIYAYKQKLWIKELTKTILDDENYKIDIVAEVVK